MKFKIIILLLCIYGFIALDLSYNIKNVYPKNIYTAWDLQNWMVKNFVYQVDINGHFKKPIETVRDRGGDCEDFAILACHVLKQLGKKCHLVALFDNRGGHAIAIFKDIDGKWSYFDNQYYIPLRTDDKTKIFDRSLPEWKIALYMIKSSRFFWRYKLVDK